MSNYTRGRAWEYEVKRRLANHGWTVFRLASSKPYDLLAFKSGRRPLVVECKLGRPPSRRQTALVRSDLATLGLRYLVAKKQTKTRKGGSN